MNEFQDESNESLEPQADPMPEAGENISQDSQESQDSQQDTQESAPEVSGSDTVESAEPAQPEDESSEQVEAAPSEQPEEIDGEVVDEGEEEAETEPEAESDNSTEDADEATEAEAVEEDSSTEEAEAEDDGSDEAPEEVAEEVVEPEAEAEPEPEPESETESDDSAEDAPFDPHNIPKKYDSQTFEWYILKVQVNRETSIRDGLLRRIKMEGLEEYFEEVIVPTEDIVEFTRSGKRKVVKRKLYPGYIMVNMMLQDDSWFLVRETPGIGDFTGTLGKPSPMPADEVERILSVAQPEEEADGEDARYIFRFLY